MTDTGPALLASSARHLSRSHGIITFPTSGGGSWEIWDRFLAIRGERVFEIGNICGTCEFWFRRLRVAASIDIASIELMLADGLTSLQPDAVDAFASLLQDGTWRIALLRLVPIRTEVGSVGDYFSNEQRTAWNLVHDPSHDPGTPYYRVKDRSGTPAPKESDLVYEFLAPLQAPEGLDPERVGFFERRLAEGSAPTAVAVSVLDVKGYYDSPSAHWGLIHYLLDGHHKVEAAARTGRALTLLSFMTAEHGISSPEQVDQLLAGYGGPL